MADSDDSPTKDKGSTSQDKQSLSPTSVPHNIRPNTLNTSGSDAYWFAHAADPPQDRLAAATHNDNNTPTSDRGDDSEVVRRYLNDNRTDNDGSPGGQAAATMRARGQILSPGQNSEYKEDAAAPLSQKEREERFRIFKERQEEERQRRLHELQQQSVLAQKFREQQEEERKRRIDELRQKDLERRMAVEERKRQIWEAEQERKEAILRRNLDREAKIEARRNAQRNSMAFAFGSSTPRVIDLDLGGFANRTPANPFGTVTLMPSVNGRKSEENHDLYKRRVPSTDLLDQKTDTVDGFDSDLSRSFERSPSDPPLQQASSGRRSFGGMSSEATKACLTIPDYNVHSSAFGREHQMSTSHYDLWSNTSSTSFGWLSGSGVMIGEDPMSRSMVILPSASRGRRRTDLTPTIPWERESSIRSHSPASSSGLSASKRAVSMSRLDILAQPRRRYIVDHSPSSSNIASSTSRGGTVGSTSGNTTPGGPRTTSSSMSKSMLNLANSQTFRRGVVAGLKDQSKGGRMSSSMLHIAGVGGSSTQSSKYRPFISSQRSPTRVLSPAFQSDSLANDPQGSKRMSQSMVQLASRPPPRPTRASRLRVANAAQAQKDGHSTSVLALNPIGSNGTSSVTELRKESPNRPRSSMSGTSELSGTSSMASTVSMRSHSGPRRPRPASMVASIPDQAPTPPQRQSRTDKKHVPVGVTPPRPPRAKSAGPADAVPPPKPPPRRAAPAKSMSSEPIAPPIEKPVASVMPNTIEGAPIAETTPVEVKNSELPTEKNLEKESDSKDDLEQDISKPVDIQPIPGTIAKARITSEEEAKAALAEKRRLAREQAEREAKLERQRQEELQRQEEERIRLEEEEQRRLEEEQIRLAEELRRQEEEKLQKAIKAQEEREAEERKRLEEEAKLKAEREEQEKKAREEAEKLRKETEEKLKKEEAERAERKKRVEQIMKRTRTKTSASQKEEQVSSSEQNMVIDQSVTNSEDKTANHFNGQESQSVTSEKLTKPAEDDREGVVESNLGDKSELVEDKAPTTESLDISSSVIDQNGLESSHEVINIAGVPPDETLVPKSVVEQRNNVDHYNGSIIQTNGYGDLEKSLPQEKSSNNDAKSDANVGNLLDFDSLPHANQPIGSSSSPPPPGQFDELIDLSQLPTTTTSSNVASNENEVNLFNRDTDDLNSNRVVSNNPFIAFEDNVTKKQESSFTDLLS